MSATVQRLFVLHLSPTCGAMVWLWVLKQNDTKDELAENPAIKAHLHRTQTQEDFMRRNLRWYNIITQAKSVSKCKQTDGPYLHCY